MRAQIAGPAFLLAVLCLALQGCSLPRAPDVEPISLEVTAIGTDGVTARVELEVRNPNDFAVTARSVTARITVAERYPLGPVTVARSWSVAACSKQRVAVEVKSSWTELPALAPLAVAPDGVPYLAQGTVSMGSDWLHFDVPFEKRGTIPQKMLIAGAAKSLGIPTLPGFPGLGGR